MAEFPKFKYHPDPIGTEAFKKADEPRVCQCCGKKTEALAKRTPG
ncbi:CbrC family protein [Ruminococcus sp.]|nr:CbrC family protein [Ruminococcus sp.]